MVRQLLHWNSFWDLASPERAAEALTELYGSGAALAAAYCGLAAYGDDRHDDYRFWVAVFGRLREAEQRPAAIHVPHRRYDDDQELMLRPNAVN
jgi:hypothetical protein